MIRSEKLDHKKLLKELKRYDLDRFVDSIIGLARPCLRLETKARASDNLPVGASKIGGNPDVPSDFVWPARHDAPLHFLGQINLTECAHPTLPAHPPGLLSFFFDRTSNDSTGPDNTGAGRVFYFPMSSVPELNRNRSVEPEFEPCKVTFHARLSLPDLGGVSVFADAVPFDEDSQDAYNDFYSLHDEFLDLVGDHQLYGYHEFTQRDPFEELQLELTGMTLSDLIELGRTDKQRADQFRMEAQRWELLMQFGEDDEAEMGWVDGGCAYFCYPPGHIARQKFDSLWTIVMFD